MITVQNINANRLGHNCEWESSRFTDENRYRLDKNHVYLGTYRRYPDNTPLAKGINKGQNQYEKRINQETKDSITKNLNKNKTKKQKIFNPMRITKRYMHQVKSTLANTYNKVSIKNALQKVTANDSLGTSLIINKTEYNIQKRSFATIGVVFRNNYKKQPYQKPKVDASDNSEIMPDNDCSGFSHPIAVHIDGKDPNFFRVVGTFSTSKSPYNGVKPIFVNNTTIKGETKPQYLHEVHQRKKIEKTAVTLDSEAT